MDDLYSPRLGNALHFVADAFRGIRRKTSPAPALAHVLGTASRVAYWGGSEDQVIAALLHDVLEDTCYTMADLRTQFSAATCNIVADCTDAPSSERAESNWELRKKNFVARLSSIPASSALVIAADKVDNLESITRDLAVYGSQISHSTTAGLVATYTYYSDVLEMLRVRLSNIAEREYTEALARCAAALREHSLLA